MECVEAGRIDGAGERRIFFSIVVPQIWPTVVTVFITVLIGVMKVFDSSYVTTNGADNTDVITRLFYDELYTQGNNGAAAAIVVILLIAVIPVLLYQVRHFRARSSTMTTTLQPGTGTPADDPQLANQAPNKPGRGAGSATWPVRVGLLILCIAWMIPALGMLVNSFRPRDEQFASGWWTAFFNPFGSSWTLSNYSTVLTSDAAGIPMAQAFLNSLMTMRAMLLSFLLLLRLTVDTSFSGGRGRYGCRLWACRASSFWVACGVSSCWRARAAARGSWSWSWRLRARRGGRARRSRGARAARSRRAPRTRLEAAGERRGRGVAGMEQRLGVAGGDARGDRDPDRSAELLGGVQKPGREPGLVLLDARERGDRDRDERERGPGAGDHDRAREVGQVVPVDGHLGRPDHARADQRHPDRHYDLGPDAGDEQLREAGERDRRQRRGQPRHPGLKRAVVQHLLHVQGADEEEREEAAAQQQPRHVRAGERPQPEDRKRQERRLDPVLDHQERDEQRRGRREHRDRSRGAPAVLRRLGDRVHEQHQRRRCQRSRRARRTAAASWRAGCRGRSAARAPARPTPIGTFR